MSPRLVGKTASTNSASCRLANVAGTQEPIYGPSAIKSVSEEAKETPYTELARKDLVWKTMDSTSVETQTFYLMSDSGKVASLQVIYSNVAYGKTGPKSLDTLSD